MLDANVLRAIAALTSLLITGEALALLVGMHFFIGNDNPWISFKNDLLIGLDVIAGLGLIAVLLLNEDVFRSNVFYLATFIAVFSHGYREWEFIADSNDNKFCATEPLFVVNNLKLLGLLLIAAIASSL